MASIEVSLSTTPRRKKSITTTGTSLSATTTPTPPAPPNNASIGLFRSSKDIAKELESLRNTLRDKENVIHSLKGQLCTSLSISRLSAGFLQRQQGIQLTEKERRSAEERLQRLRADLDTKRLAIKSIKFALERLDITDNIDVRIQQAELEYQLGREELNLLTILEESRNLQACLEDSAHNKETDTVFNYVKDSLGVTVHSVELNFDPKSPQFGAGPNQEGPGLYVEWAVEDSGLAKGDRLLEVNGKFVLCSSKEDMLRLFSVSPERAQIAVLRKRAPQQDQLMSTLRAELSVVREKAGEAERTRDSFRSDNVRLTHRISYLEEQVAELLSRTREENPVSPPPPPSPSEVQVFQKGPQVTALVANLPGLEVDSPADARNELPTLHSRGAHKAERPTMDSRSVKSLDLDKNPTRVHKKKINMLNARSTNSLDVLEGKPLVRHHHDHSTHLLPNGQQVREAMNPDNSIDNLRRQTEHLEIRQRHLREARSSLFEYERERRNSKGSDFDSEPSFKPNRHYTKQADKGSHKSLDYSSESSLRHYKKHVEASTARPVPPKKPLRLSLHRATSLQSVEAGEKKPIKRNHKGEAPPPPITMMPSHNWHPNAVYRQKHIDNEKWC